MNKQIREAMQELERLLRAAPGDFDEGPLLDRIAELERDHQNLLTRVKMLESIQIQPPKPMPSPAPWQGPSGPFYSVTSDKTTPLKNALSATTGSSCDATTAARVFVGLYTSGPTPEEEAEFKRMTRKADHA